MQFLLDFLRKKAPESGGDIPGYYRRALITSEAVLGSYFLIKLLLIYLGTQHWAWFPFVLSLVTFAGIYSIDHAPLRVSLGVYAAVTFTWCAWYVHNFGWGCGGQHFLIPLLILLFFNIYDAPWLKIIYFFACIAFRMGLFSYSLSHAPVFELERHITILFQTVNSLLFFAMMACLCILFSSNLQETERKLRLDNQELHKEAGTDPLTQLPNRRAMLNDIDKFQKEMPRETFSVAIADIDFFKKVNDTYGHNCGDYTLRTLADLFREKSEGNYTVCRWGGEEFCFLLPGRNLDEAAGVMMEICNDVRHMALSFETYEFKITITIGIEENDFVSPLNNILEKADQKLYMGKNSGRDQVVV